MVCEATYLARDRRHLLLAPQQERISQDSRTYGLRAKIIGI
jgi:hypothetical protein